MEIKKEEPKDYAEIYEVVKRAFNSAECAECVENWRFIYSIIISCS